MKKRIEAKRQRKADVLAQPGAWLLFWLGWSFNTQPPNRPEPFFESIGAMKKYYLENKSRVIDAMGDTTDFWAWHAFEEHDRANCEYCQTHDIKEA